MDLQKIKDIVNSDLDNKSKEYKVLGVLAKDKKAIPTILEMLDRERKIKEEVQSEMNLLLSKAHIGLDNKKFNSGNFMQKEIIEFYTKYKDYVGHCFKNLNL